MTQPPDETTQPGEGGAAGPGAETWAPPSGSPPYGAPQYGAPQYGAPQQYAQPAPGTYIDPTSGLQLPQGVQLASVGRRIGAYFLAIPLFVVTLGIGYLIWGLMIWRKGQTPALQVLKMRCWRPETQRVATFWWMALREIVGRFAEGVLSVITALVSFILFLTGKERKSLHDHIAGTVVLHDPHDVL